MAFTLNQSHSLKIVLGLAGILVVIGITMLMRNFAASRSIFLEAEESITSLDVVADTAASGGNYIAFADSTPPPPPPPPNFDIKSHLLDSANGARSEETPYGVPSHWSWVAGADGAKTSPPAGHSIVNYWGAVFRNQSNQTPANTHVEIRNCTFWVLYDDQAQWVKLQDPPLGGASFSPTYFGGSGSPELTHVPDGANVVPHTGDIWHFWAASGQAPIRHNNVKDVIVNCRARLALKNPSGTDDRGSAGYIIHLGADWRNPNDIGCANTNYICPSFGVGKFYTVTNEWRQMAYHTLSAQEINGGATLPPPAVFGLN